MLILNLGCINNIPISNLRGSGKYVKEKLAGKSLLIAEIGVQRAKNSVAMLKELNISRLFLVDPYKPYIDSSFNFSENLQNEIYSQMFLNISPYFSKVSLISKKSLFASKLFSKEFFDFVYIDGRHQYQDVINDLEAWWPLVKKGGILGGHDIGHVEFTGVAKAVEKFSSKISKKFKIVGDSDWIIDKN